MQIKREHKFWKNHSNQQHKRKIQIIIKSNFNQLIISIMKKLITILMLLPLVGISQQNAGSYIVSTAKQLINKISGSDYLRTEKLQNTTTNCATSSTTTVTSCSNSLPYIWNGVAYNREGIYVYHSINNAGCDSAASLILNIKYFAADTIYGPVNTCAFSGETGAEAIYTVAGVGATNYVWSLPAGTTILSNTGSGTIYIKYASTFRSGIIKVTVTGICGLPIVKSLYVSRLSPAVPGIINGPANACALMGTNNTVVYSVSPVANAITYRWTLPSTIKLLSATADSTSITVKFLSGYATEQNKQIKVKSISGCGNSSDRQLNISLTPLLMPGVISGPIDMCTYMLPQPTREMNLLTYTIRKIGLATSYNWSVPTGLSINSHPAGLGANDTCILVTVSPEFAGFGFIKVSARNECGTSSERALAIKTVSPVAPAAISGPLDVCSVVVSRSRAVYTINKVPLATGYNWSVSNVINSSIVAHSGTGENDTSVTVQFGDNYVAGLIIVNSVRNCGVSALRRLMVYKLAPDTPTVTGSNNLCGSRSVANSVPGTKSQVYTAYSNSTSSFLWKIPAGTTSVMSLHGSSTITVFFPPDYVTGILGVRAVSPCGTSKEFTMPINNCLPAQRVDQRKVTATTLTSGFKIYPNPANTDFTVEINTIEKTPDILISIVDEYGQSVYQRKEKNTSGKILFRVKNIFPKGVYLVNYSAGAERNTQKLIITK